MRWLIRAWKDYISDKTIQNHYKAVLNGQNNIQTINHYPLLEGVHTGLSDWYLRSLIKKENIVIDQFLDSVEEDVTETSRSL